MPKSFSNGYAVVVGVGADLPVTIKDAEAISSTLLDPTRCAYQKNHVRLLTDKTARRESIISELKWLAKSAGEDDTAIVYYSGHGIETPDFHLVPFGFAWSDLGGTAISGAEFTKLLQAIKTRKLLVLLDCCHAGGQADAKEKGFVKSPLPPEVMDELGSSSGRVVVASTRKDEVSWTGKPYSEFTTAVLESLAGRGAFEEDGYARVLDLALYVGRFVPERTDDKQHPIIKVNNLQDNYAIAWYAGGSLKPKELPWEVGQPATPPAQETGQVETWHVMLGNYRGNLLLIEERMSEYVEFNEIPLQLIKSQRQVMAKIKELEARLPGR